MKSNFKKGNRSSSGSSGSLFNGRRGSVRSQSAGLMRVPLVRQLSAVERLAVLQQRTRQRSEAKAKENSFWWLCLQSDDKLIMIYRGSIDPYKFYLLIISVFYLHFLKILIRIHSILHANRLRFWNWTFQINLTKFTYAHRLIPVLGFVHFEYFEWIMLPRQQHVVQHDFSWRKYSCGFLILYRFPQNLKTPYTRHRGNTMFYQNICAYQPNSRTESAE